MNAVVLGGTGFIGSELVRALVARGDNVVSASRSGKTDIPVVHGLALDLQHENCPQAILNDSDDIYVLIGQISADFDRTTWANALQRLAIALKSCSARVIYFSTVHVYGHTPTPANEQAPCAPMDDKGYGAFKLESEGILKDHIAPERLTILRLTNIYGTPKNRGFINFVLRAALSGQDVKLNGDGQQQRDYLLLDDLVKIVAGPVRDRTDLHGIVNLATGTAYRNEEVVQLAQAVSHKPIAYTILHNQVNEPQDTLLDNTRLREMYGVTTFTPLKEGLALTLARYQREV
jgi:UDP-glucose 4-epimerase